MAASDIYSSLHSRICTDYSAKNDSLDSVSEGGVVRAARGNLVESMIDTIADALGLEARVGSKDFQTITVTDKRTGKVHSQKHQVDRHIYHKGKLVAIVECKAYLDSCYYVRACSDFARMKMAHPDIKCFLFALEDSISEESRVFTDAESNYVCDDIFFLCEGKRSSAKPIYKKEFAKPLLADRLKRFIQAMESLVV